MLQEKSVRLDLWLWAARFYKTRKLSQQAIKGGKVHHNNQHCKPGQSVHVGMQLTIRQGHFEKTVNVKALTSKRGNAATAEKLYEETKQSIAARELALERYQENKLARIDMLERPNKKQRRQLSSLFKKN